MAEVGTATVRVEADTTPIKESIGELQEMWGQFDPIEVKRVPHWFGIAHRLAELGLLLLIAIKV